MIKTQDCARCNGIGQVTADIYQGRRVWKRCPDCQGTGRKPAPEAVAWGRAETEPCERGTPGCSVLHTYDSDCQPW